MESVSRVSKSILKEFGKLETRTAVALISCIRNALTKVDRFDDDDEKLLKEMSKKGSLKKISLEYIIDCAGAISRSRMASEICSVDIICALAKVIEFNGESLYKYLLSEMGRPISTSMDIMGNMCAEAMGYPIVGRIKEIGQLAACMARKGKIPFVIGKPGAGKTSVLMGLARLISFNAIPQLNGLLLLDTSKYLPPPVEMGPGQVQMVQQQDYSFGAPGQSSSNIVAVFDGASRRNAVQIAMMSRTHRIAITCDEEEYRSIISASKDLERNAIIIRVAEPDLEETKEIIRLKGKQFEHEFNCTIPQKVLDYAVDVSTKFHCESSQPERSISLLEISCAKKRIQLGKNVKYLGTDIDKAVREKNINLLRELVLASSGIESAKTLMQHDKIEIDMNDISESLRITAEISKNVPIDAITADSIRQLKMLEEYVRTKVYGQDQAIVKVCSTIRRKSLNLQEPFRPASFLFVGPTGVGKTYLAQSIAELLFGSEKAIIRFDMSEYMERHSASKLIGAPPGYVGYEKGGKLTNEIYKRPYCVLLLDEIEKAHPDVLDTMLQVLDNGRLTDSRDREVNFEHVVIIMTSNLGTKSSVKFGIGFGSKAADSRKEKVSEEIKEFLRPEFINRLNGIVHFNALDDKSLREIMSFRLNHIGDYSSYKIKITKSVIDHMMEKVKKNEDIEIYGAREVKRMVDTDIADLIAQEIIDKALPAGTIVTLSVKEEKLVAIGEKDAK